MAEVPATSRALAEVQMLALDRASGAAEIAARAAAALGELPSDETLGAMNTLLSAHPSMAPLWRLATRILESSDRATGAGRFLDELSRDERAAPVAAAILPDRVLTISWSSSVLEAIRLRRPALVLCMLSEPGGEGERTAEAAAKLTTARVVADDEAISRIPADAVLVGADAVTPRWLINKAKTRDVVKAAGSRGIPSYTVAGGTKFVSPAVPVASEFDATPLELFRAIATPEGMLAPAEARARAERHAAHPELVPLLERLLAASAQSG